MRILVAIFSVAVLVLAASTSSASAEDSDFCSRCDTSGLRYRLVRGDSNESEATSCEAGVYCDCDRERAERCFLWPLGRRFNEESQRCEFSFDCRAWLADNPAVK